MQPLKYIKQLSELKLASSLSKTTKRKKNYGYFKILFKND